MPKTGVLCAMEYDGQLLLVQRGKKDAGYKTWHFPGGHPESAESLEDAICREVMEETHLELNKSSVGLIGDPIFDEHFDYFLYLFHAKAMEHKDPVPDDDAMDARWVPLTALNNYPMTDTMRHIVETYLNFRATM